MNLIEAKNFFLEGSENLPERQMCCEISEQEMKKIFEEKNLVKMLDFFLQNDLDLRVEEFDKIRFQVVLCFICVNEFEFYGLYEDEVWDIETDDATANFLQNVKKLLGNEENDLSCVSLSDFLAYARSDKPDF